jgi:predicted DNA-binding antitoxin AbrB/MazE fold protein
MNSKLWVVAFDIGKKNFCWCIEEYDPISLKNIKNIQSFKRYKENGLCSEEMEEILNKVYENGKIISHKNVDLTDGCDSKKKLDPLTFHNMTEVLDQYSELWDKCSIILIEEQMHFGKKLNLMAVKLAQHCYSYFTFKYGRFKPIIEFPAYHKTQVLGAPKIEGKPYKSGKKRYKALEKPARKKWAIEKSISILTNRNELDFIIKNKKKDDLADTFLMVNAYKYMAYVDNRF